MTNKRTRFIRGAEAETLTFQGFISYDCSGQAEKQIMRGGPASLHLDHIPLLIFALQNWTCTITSLRLSGIPATILSILVEIINNTSIDTLEVEDAVGIGGFDFLTRIASNRRLHSIRLARLIILDWQMFLQDVISSKGIQHIRLAGLQTMTLRDESFRWRTQILQLASERTSISILGAPYGNWCIISLLHDIRDECLPNNQKLKYVMIRGREGVNSDLLIASAELTALMKVRSMVGDAYELIASYVRGAHK